MLLDHYGPTMYSKMTSEFDPVGLAALDSQLGQYLNIKN